MSDKQNIESIEHENDNTARVVAVHRERYELDIGGGARFARLKSAVYYGDGDELFPTVGDLVRIHAIDSGDSLIVATLPRRSCFARREPGPIPRAQAVAANFDYVFIMASLNQNFNLPRIERYLTQAWQSGARPVVVLTKADLTADPGEQVRAVERIAPGVGVYAVSAYNGAGLDDLRALLTSGTIAVFLGSSGVGKSSLVNALTGKTVMDVKAIREGDARGRHTTTHRQLIPLPNGAALIDTPGMRELGLWEVDSGLGESFGEVEAYLGRCRFADCMHGNEPGCVVRAALDSGELTAERWENYQKLKREARFTDRKAVIR